MACLRELAGAGELADVRIFGVLDDFALFAVAQRADDAARVFFVGHHRGHPAELSLVEHVHQERLHDVVHVVAERNLVVSVLAGELDEFGAALRAAPVAVELASFLESPFHRHVLEEEWNLRVLRCELLQKISRRLVREVALDMDGAYFAVGQKLPHATREFHQQHARILATAHRNEYLVTVLD